MLSIVRRSLVLSISSAAALSIFAFAAGCQKTAEIGHYEIPHVARPETTAPDSSAPDRMLAAVVPHGKAAWFFKLAGPAETVGKYADAFQTFVHSVSFSDGDDAKPKWTLPSGWEAKEGGADLRYATITIPEKPPLELTVSTLPWGQDVGMDEMGLDAALQDVLKNVNRWRVQLTLAPLEVDELADNIHLAKTSAGEVLFVDFKGTLKPGGMQPPFAGGPASAGEIAGDSKPSEQTGERSLPAGHPPISGQPLPPGHPPMLAQNSEASPAGATTDSAADENLPFTYKLPDDWKQSKKPPFAVAAFGLEKDSQKIEVTATPLGKGAGGMLSNVNRWRSQLKLPEVDEDGLKTIIKPYKLDGKEAHMVQLVGPEATNPRMAITVVFADHDDATWFFRMRGDADLVKAEQPDFEKFIESVKFKAGEK